jgi:hypothetical protein
MALAVMDKKEVNSTGLVDKIKETLNEAIRPLGLEAVPFSPEIEAEVIASNTRYSVQLPNGEILEDKFKTKQEALNSLCDDSDDIEELARTHFHEEGWKPDSLHIADYISGNIAELAEQCGYKIVEVMKS